MTVYTSTGQLTRASCKNFLPLASSLESLLESPQYNKTLCKTYSKSKPLSYLRIHVVTKHISIALQVDMAMRDDAGRRLVTALILLAILCQALKVLASHLSLVYLSP